MDIKPGDVWLVKDEVIDFPEDRLPEGSRESHPYRPVIVVSRLDECVDNVGYRSITVVPTSSKCNTSYRNDLFLVAGTGGLDMDSYARVRTTQPVLKVDLERKIGTLPYDILVNLKVKIATHFGLMDVPQ